MGNFDRGGRGGGGGFRGSNSGGFQKKSWGNDRGGDRGDRVMYDAVCTECGKDCQVPFRPSGDKPVLCSACFGGKRDEGGDRAPRRDFNDRGPKRDFDRPRPDFVRPVGNDDTKKQFAELNAKLDRLATAIEKMTSGKQEAVSAPKAAPAPVAEKVAKAKAPAKKVAVKKVAKKK